MVVDSCVACCSGIVRHELQVFLYVRGTFYFLLFTFYYSTYELLLCYLVQLQRPLRICVRIPQLVAAAAAVSFGNAYR